jgi:hypothetical protein
MSWMMNYIRLFISNLIFRWHSSLAINEWVYFRKWRAKKRSYCFQLRTDERV